MVELDSLQQYLHQLPPKYEAVSTTELCANDDAAPESSQNPSDDSANGETGQPLIAVDLNLPSPAQILDQLLTRPSNCHDKAGSCELCADALDDARQTPCGHTFCNTCIRTALTQRDTCPTCDIELFFPFATYSHSPKQCFKVCLKKLGAALVICLRVLAGIFSILALIIAVVGAANEGGSGSMGAQNCLEIPQAGMRWACYGDCSNSGGGRDVGDMV